MSEKFWDSVREENDEKNKALESRQKEEEAERKFRDDVYLAVLPAVVATYRTSVSIVIQHTEDIVDAVMRRRNKP